MTAKRTIRPARLVFAEEAKAYQGYFLCDSPEASCEYWANYIQADLTIPQCNENLIVLLLNTRLKVFAHHVVSQGTVNETLVHPRNVLRPAIVQNAHCFILMHNHPSGDPSPSTADRTVTKRICEAADLMQIRFLDHVIFGAANNHFSFQEAGLM